MFKRLCWSQHGLIVECGAHDNSKDSSWYKEATATATATSKTSSQLCSRQTVTQLWILHSYDHKLCWHTQALGDVSTSCSICNQHPLHGDITMQYALHRFIILDVRLQCVLYSKHVCWLMEIIHEREGKCLSIALNSGFSFVVQILQLRNSTMVRAIGQHVHVLQYHFPQKFDVFQGMIVLLN